MEGTSFFVVFKVHDQRLDKFLAVEAQLAA